MINQTEALKRMSLDDFKQIPIFRWQKIAGTGKKYTPRTGHECIIYQEKIYLFGGMDDDDRRNDLYQFDIYTNVWEKMISQGDIPSSRSGSRGVAFSDNCLYFFGGYSK